MAATGRSVAREMILPDWDFIRREAAVACRVFYAPFKGILEAVAALRGARAVQKGSFDPKTVVVGTSDLAVDVHKSENEPFPSGVDFDLVGGGFGDAPLLGTTDLVFLEHRDDLIDSLEGERLFSEDGDDLLIGGIGNDLLLGGQGDDDYNISFGKPIVREAAYFGSGNASGVASNAAESSLLAAAAEAHSARRRLHALFGRRLFSDPSWDILLELLVNTLEGRKIAVSTACMAASAPITTALRHIAYLVQEGLAVRRHHPADPRSTYLELTPLAIARLTQYFSDSESWTKRPSGSSIASSRSAGR